MPHRLACARFASAVYVGVSLLTGAPAGAASIMDEWASVKAPPPPEVKPVITDPKTTALLVLDLVRQGCNEQRRPRCLPTVAPIHALLEKARAAGMPVVYSLVANSTAADVLKEVAPLGSEPIVTSGTDKFLGTDLDKILRDKGIKTVIVVGTAAHGAVLTTVTAAALRGFSVIVPVDGLSSETPYAEQYTVWNLVNAPVISSRVTLTKTDTIAF